MDHQQRSHNSGNNAESNIEQQKKSTLDINQDKFDRMPKKNSHFSDTEAIKERIINNRYNVESLIGHGGMCDVYRAKDLLLEAAGVRSCYVALKVLQNEHMSQRGASKILIKEAQKTQQLSHPNIVRVYDFGSDNNAHFLIMEWLDGETLEEVIQRSRPNGLSFDKAIKLLEQIISALSYAHSQGVVHADLKPSNIMLTRDGQIKLFDFGVSRALNLNLDYYSAQHQEETNVLSGYTPTYASPNLLKGNEPEIKDDIFAFTCIAYELLTSRHPFERKPADIAEINKLEAPKPKNINRKNWQVLKRGLAFEPEQRPASFDELTVQLRKRYRPFIAAGIAITLMLSVIGYSYMLKHDQVLNLTSEIQFTEKKVENDRLLTALPTNQLLEKLSTIPDEQHLLLSGLLYERREQVVAIYQEKIDDLLTNRTERYPDYYAIEKEIILAQKLYPDSLTLNLINERIINSWSSTIEMLNQSINALLEKGDYYRRNDGNDVYQLLNDLNNVKSNYIFKPTTNAELTFVSRLESASNNLDFTELKRLIETGDLFFPNTLKQDTFAFGADTLRSSINEMAQYDHQLEQGLTPSFPYQAAQTLYANTFAHFDSLISQSTTIAQLDKISDSITAQAQSLPDDFLLLNQARLAMASKYLSFSDQLLKSGKERTASTAMKKANNLFAQVNQNRTTI